MSKARQSRRDAARKDRQEAEKGDGFQNRQAFIVGQETLEDLNISQYTTASAEDGGELVHKAHLLPAHKDDPDLLAFKLYFHRSIGANDQSALCPKWMAQYLHELSVEIPAEIRSAKCPVCEEHDKELEYYKKHKDGVGEKERKELYAVVRNLQPFSGGFSDPKPKAMLGWVVDATDKDTEEEGTKFFIMPYTKVYKLGILDQSEDMTETDEGGDPEFIDLLDPVNGYVFMFKRWGLKWYDVDYGGYRVKKRGWDISDWCKDVPRFLDVLKFHTYDELAEMLGTVDEEGGNEDLKNELEDEFDKGRDAEPRTRRRSRRESKDETEAPDEEPRRRRKREPEPKPEPESKEPNEEPNPYDEPEESEEKEEVSEATRTIQERIKERRRKRNEE
ncbi:hypothetical protein LCGC14_0235130 [marine sediment metagenome]|uniref:Bacteriophage T4 Gp32 single-stranded DNA-binding domain-containing protein n=1 Tax=marine sediment metagenome TaxID=412755 RepID=A0A0F9UQ63_9ZZZZ